MTYTKKGPGRKAHASARPAGSKFKRKASERKLYGKGAGTTVEEALRHKN